MAAAAASCKRASSAVLQAFNLRIVDHATPAFETLGFLHAAGLTLQLTTLIVSRTGLTLGHALADFGATLNSLLVRLAVVRTAVGVLLAQVATRAATGCRRTATHAVGGGNADP